MAGKRQKQDSHPFSAFLSRLSTIAGNLRKDIGGGGIQATEKAGPGGCWD